MSWPVVIKNDDGIRPAGNPDECFYCQRKIGEEHSRECVTITKLVKVRYIYEIEIPVPNYWSSEDIEFHRNESSWCADNSFDEIEAYIGDNCACKCFKAEFVSDVDTTPRQAPPHSAAIVK